MDPYLIAQPDGSRWPWGWGAVMVDTPEKGWVCTHCGKAQKLKNRGRHHYMFGEPRCTACATEWCKANWPPFRTIKRRLRARSA